MTGYPATHHCNQCKEQTPHREILVRKPSEYDGDTSPLGRVKLFVSSVINGGHYYNMDRYVTCQVCGTKELDNKGNEFE
ncbi:hypothetical protein [Vibrio mexicanus]|uniref:hypothetical protein n=1 Tax=Vibrio mexicanus TaxID=1004326 RepID=UPI00063C04E7|nr:hypothetical protein [Vibrio mexicanus]